MPFNFLLLEKERVGGRLSLFSHFWPSTSKDPWVLNSITEGSRIPFKSPPFQLFPGLNMAMSEDIATFVMRKPDLFKVKGLLTKYRREKKVLLAVFLLFQKIQGG